MKLVFCPSCTDIVKFGNDAPRYCQCGKSFGYYKADRSNGVVGGKGVPIGFGNRTFAAAVRARPATGDGAQFTAFVIPDECKTVEKGR